MFRFAAVMVEPVNVELAVMALVVIAFVPMLLTDREDAPIPPMVMVDPVIVDATVRVFVARVEPVREDTPRNCVVRVEPRSVVVLMEDPMRLEKYMVPIVRVEPVSVLTTTLFSPRLFVHSCLPLVLTVNT